MNFILHWTYTAFKPVGKQLVCSFSLVCIDLTPPPVPPSLPGMLFSKSSPSPLPLAPAAGGFPLCCFMLEEQNPLNSSRSAA